MKKTDLETLRKDSVNPLNVLNQVIDFNRYDNTVSVTVLLRWVFATRPRNERLILEINGTFTAYVRVFRFIFTHVGAQRTRPSGCMLKGKEDKARKFLKDLLNSEG